MSFSQEDENAIAGIVHELKQTKNILFITGAGLSADSNLPTYRGVSGLYNNDKTEDGIPIEMALSGPMFTRRPDISWKHIRRIEDACRGARFNRGHKVIAEMEAHFPRVWVLTQNVDGFHVQAGSKNVIDIHGSIHVLRCTQCHYNERVEDYSHIMEAVPKCDKCGGVIRPNVVLFEEMLPTDKFARLNEELGIGFEMIFSVGTSSLFPYIVEPVVRARFEGIPTVEINPGDTDISQMVTYKVASGAAVTLDAIWTRFKAGL